MKNFKLAFNLASGYYAAKLLWKIIGGEILELYNKANDLFIDYLVKKAQNNNETAIKVCEIYNINYKQNNFKPKETIGFRKE